MIKFLYSTDWHSKEKSPSTRKDDFGETVELKLRDFFRTGHRLEVDAFLCGGDYFDSPHVSPTYVRKIGDLMKDEMKGKKMYGVWGNHDLIGWNPATVNRLAHGLFQHFFDDFLILGREPTFFEKEGERVALTGVSSYARLDKHLYEEDGETVDQHRARDYIIQKETEDPAIHIVHGYLSPKPILDEIPHTVIDEIKDTEADVILTGHEHVGFPVKQLTDQTKVFNPGALSRVFASHAEMNRMPQYALITVEGKHVTVEPVQCQVARKGEDVMDRSVLEEKKRKEKIIEESKREISDVIRSLDIKGVDLSVIFSAYKDKVSTEVYEEAKQRLNLQ